ncbi:multiple epidermal growth factor-like domains protein 10 isoform X2 [Haliotis rufescens]|uniref:multiple epidermal growth factor-like domains protein 10 isoform X2 n=1 Tax=Haliotis rufescens TaxID=6454 RepID=UPI00201F5C99|nr:multiple epidermal growth factor-like domains protein 10 isoform X2 [Haliotis rufescens]
MAVWASVAFVIASLSLAAGVRENVALNKIAWMSTTRQPSQSAGRAVDGVTTANGEDYSIHTKGDESTAWWKLDLQTQVQSAQVTIYFRTDFKARRNGLQLYASVTNSSEPKEGSLCHTVTGSPDGTDIPDVLEVTCPGTWRYLTVYTETSNDGQGAVLDFAEVEVWTCTSGYYGSNCEQRCDARQCKMTSSCDVQGQCVGGCAAGYQGTDCIQACTSGMYGPNCARECSSRHCKTRPSSCDRVIGRCPDGCEDGWTEIDCTRNCADGFYGNNCSLKCADRHCTSTSCLVDGACSAECDVGWTRQDCTQECPSGLYDINCKSTCGHCADNNTCHHVNGTCPGGCQAGWELPLCQTGCDNGKFGVNCERHCDRCNGTCDAVDGRCLWGCAEGYTGSKCAVKRGKIYCVVHHNK